MLTTIALVTRDSIVWPTCQTKFCCSVSNIHASLSDFDILFLRPCAKIPQTENTRFAKACDAGAELRSSAKSAIKPNEARRCDQKFGGDADIARS